MRIRTLFVIVAALAGLLMVRKGGIDPRAWPDVLKAECARMGDHAKAAAAAGKKAAARREKELEDEIQAAMNEARP